MHSAGAGGSFCARRDFLKAMLAAPFVLPHAWAGGLELRIGLFYDDVNHDALLGAHMSIQESQRAATLLNGSLTVIEKASSGTIAVVPWVNANTLSAIVLACQADTVARLLPEIAKANVVVINCAARPADVPGLCKAGVCSILPAGNTPEDVVVWDAALEKFGAAQLNARYQAMHRRDMSPLAWSGWFAVKLLWESAARTGSGAPRALETFLASPRAAFDGHKGEMLRFDNRRVLRQPLYRVTTVNGRREIAEIESHDSSEVACD